jgi:DNA polymerase delta subunit 1
MSRYDDDDDGDCGGGFEAELAMLDEIEHEMQGDASVGEGPEAKNTSARWSRPSVASFNPKTDALVFQQIDVDFFLGKSVTVLIVVIFKMKLKVELIV